MSGPITTRAQEGELRGRDRPPGTMTIDELDKETFFISPQVVLAGLIERAGVLVKYEEHDGRRELVWQFDCPDCPDPYRSAWLLPDHDAGGCLRCDARHTLLSLRAALGLDARAPLRSVA